MSEKEEEKLESELKYIERKDISFYDVLSAITNNTDGKLLGQTFTSEQWRIIRALAKAVNDFIEFHTSGDDDEPHKNIKAEIEKVDARLRNHRHETGKVFSAKAEF